MSLLYLVGLAMIERVDMIITLIALIWGIYREN